MRRIGLRCAVGLLILARPAFADAMVLSGRFSLLYERADTDLGPGAPRLLSDRLDLEGGANASGYFFAPGSIDWSANVGYVRLDTNRSSYYGDEQSRFLTYSAMLGVLTRPSSPIQLRLNASQVATDFASGMATQTTAGSTETRSFSGSAVWNPPGRPMLWAGATRTEATARWNGLPDANNSAWLLNAGTKHTTAAFQYAAMYYGTFSEGDYASQNYDEHRVVLNAGFPLGGRLQFAISENYQNREATTVAATNPSIENNSFSAYLRSTPADGPQQLANYQYRSTSIAIPGSPERAQTVQGLGLQDDRKLSLTWRLLSGVTLGLTQAREGDLELRGANQTVTTEARWHRNAEASSLELGAGPAVGVSESEGVVPSGNGTTNPDRFQVGYGGVARATANWDLGRYRAGANYVVTYNRAATDDWTLAQTGFLNAGFSGERLLASARLSASAQRSGSPLFGDNASRALQLDASTTWRGMTAALLASLQDGAVGPPDGSLRGDGLLVPFPFDSQTRYIDLTARVPITFRLVLAARGAYTEQRTYEVPTRTEKISSVAGEYAVGSLVLSVELRHTEWWSNGAATSEERIFARLSRTFTTAF